MQQPEKPNRNGIKAIADAIGVSIGTVDRALHGRQGVSAKTRERVLEMASKLNYRPNLSARSLKLNRRIHIAVFLPQQIASFFNCMREDIRSAAQLQADGSVEASFFDYPRLAQGGCRSNGCGRLEAI